MKLQNFLQRLNESNSQTHKINLLKEANEEVKEFLKAVFSPSYVYGIKKIPEYTHKRENYETSFVVEFFKSHLHTRILTGNNAIEKVKNILENAREPQLVEMLIQRKTPYGINTKLLNRVFGNDFIPEIPCMLAQPMNDKTLKNIKYPAQAQEKADGMRCVCVFDFSNNSNTINFFTRNGKSLELPHLETELVSILKPKGIRGILDGEILGYENNEILPRVVSNGLCNKLIKETISKEELAKLGYQVWDLVLDSNKSQTQIKRFENLKNILKESDSKYISLIDSKIVNSLKEAYDMFYSKLESGKEGIILKNLDSVWVSKRSNDLVKLKAEKTCDLKVIDVNIGEGKFSGGLGALVCETSDGLLRVNIGTGFSLEQRGLKNNEITKQPEIALPFETIKENFIGKIVEVMFNEIIEDKNTKMKSLFLPRFIKIREDKNEANSLNEI